ncbi:MAG: hypothetical protein GXP08_15015 [Gammaproteobacteria bacterium]|nr:hypothetical protein [Gammaproteobacteria bacterium]
MLVVPPYHIATADILQETDGIECQALNFPTQHELFDFETLRAHTRIDDFNGLLIRHIEVITLPIFNPNDTNENNALYRYVNNIHTPTQDDVVRRQLLFSQGEVLLSSSIAESERILRANNYLSDAVILPQRICGDKVDLAVITRELWTLLPKLFFSRKGGNNKIGLTIEDENMLGSGNTLTLQFLNDRERNSQSISYHTKQLFGSHVTFDTVYSDTTDGFEKKLQITRPFFALDTRWSLGLNLQENKFSETLEASGNEFNAFNHNQNHYRVFAGFSSGRQGGYTQRYSFGFTQTEDLFKVSENNTTIAPDDRILAYPWIKYFLIEDAFTTYQNLNALYRTEDIAIGINVAASLGLASNTFNSPLSQWIFSFNIHNVPYTLPKHLLQMKFEVNGSWDRDKDGFQNTITSLKLDYYWLLATKLRFFAGLSYDFGINLSSDKLLSLGGDEGFRGYPSEFFLGDRRLLVNLEQRYFFSPHFLNLFRFAGVIFLDIGQTKLSDNTNANDNDLLTSTGLGIRINSSKTNISRIVHIDLAFPLNKKDEIDDIQLQITSNSTF